MSLTLGRVSFPDGVVTAAPAGGGAVSLSAFLDGATTLDLLAWRALANNPDEPVVPFTSSDRPDLDGYYRIGGVGVETDGPANDGAATVTAQLVPVRDWQDPLIESIVAGGLLANDHGVVEGDVEPYWAIPSTAREVDPRTTVSDLTTVERELGTIPLNADTDETTDAADDGSVIVYTSASQHLLDARPSFRLDPANAYDGAVAIYYDAAGTFTPSSGTTFQGGYVAGDWVPIVGRQYPADGIANFLIGNGLVRLYIRVGVTNNPIQLQAYSGEEWVDIVAPAVLEDTTPQSFAPASLRVLRNSPELCAFRIGSTSGTDGIRGQLDVSLRRGARLASFAFRTGEDIAATLTDGETNGVTVITAGYHRTNAAAVMRRVCAIPEAFTVDGTFYDWDSSASLFRFAMGAEVPDATPDALDAPQSLVYQYLAGQTERQLIGGG